jgi:hypothetical protein
MTARYDEPIRDIGPDDPVPPYPPPYPVRFADGTIHYPDGTMEVDGWLFDPIDWDELDPPEGSPDAEEIPDEVVWAKMCKRLGIPPGSL